MPVHHTGEFTGRNSPNIGFRMLADMGPAELRAASPLPRDIQEQFDGAISRVGRQRMALFGALVDAGLVYALPNWYSVLHLTTSAGDDGGEAYQSMELDERFRNDMPDLEEATIPVFATWSQVQIGHRLNAVAAANNYPLDTTLVERATRKVNELVTNQTIYGIKGNNAKMHGHYAPGLLSDPLLTVTYPTGAAWTALTGEQIVGIFQSARDEMVAANMYEPMIVVIGTGYDTTLGRDYKANSDLTIRQRILELGYVQSIVVEDYWPTDYTAFIPVNREVLDVVVGQGPQRIDWQDSNHPYAPINHMVVACEILRLKPNYDGKTGIVIGYKT